MAIAGYYLGCPGWSSKTWVGGLDRYARVFNTVEGNTTFYALPSVDTVTRWRDQVPDTFRFCFKFPRGITHDKLLVDCAAEVATFLERIAPLGDKLGTLFLQLPPRFDGSLVERLATFLHSLPRDYHYAVELRHEAFFTDTPAQRDVLALLTESCIDLVTMDARGLHSGNSLDVRQRKPNLPVLVRATATRPLIRCVPHEVFDESRRFVEPWARQIADWIGEGKCPYFFMHAPDDNHAPENAYAFHAMVRAHRDVGELPPWDGASRQLSLL